MKRKNKRRMLRMLAAVLAFWMLLPVSALADTMDEIRARQEELRSENDELEARLSSLRADEAQLQEYQSALQEKIGLTERKIDESREAITLMDLEIDTLERKLARTQAEYQSTIDLFAQRLRALYRAGGNGVSTLEILLNAESFTDFTMKSAMISAVTRHDQELVDRLEEYAERTREDRESIQAMREQEAQLKKDQELAQRELTGLYTENDAVIADLEAQQIVTREEIAANEEEDAALEAEVQDMIRRKNEEEQRRREEEAAAAEAARRAAEEAARRAAEEAAARRQAEENESGGDDGTFTNEGGEEYEEPGRETPEVNVDYTELGTHEGFNPCWPLPGVSVSNITGHYGDMYSNGAHNGLDIGASYGTPIVAAQAGEVISAEFHWSWGNNVLIWHNSTYATRYAHMSAIAVSAGQYVEQGQIIGYVGSTGYAFGNHLHFEVYKDAVRVAPEPYLGVW